MKVECCGRPHQKGVLYVFSIHYATSLALVICNLGKLGIQVCIVFLLREA